MTTTSLAKIPDNSSVPKLPHGWNVTDDPKKLNKQLESKNKWAEGNNTILPHFLREDKIDANIRKNADNDKPYEAAFKDSGKCVVIQCSTGCYYAVCVPLLKEWLGMVGKPAKRLDGQGPLLQVTRVEGHVEQGGAVQSYLVKLLVEGNNVSLHFYNTNHKIIMQSKEMTSVFYNEVFLPFLEKNSDFKASMIKKLNDQVRQGKRGEKRQNPTCSKTNFPPHAKKAQFDNDVENMEVNDQTLEEKSYEDPDLNQVIPQGDQQLSESVLILSTIHPLNLLRIPRSSPCRLEIEDQNATGMDVEEIIPMLAAPGLDGQHTTSTPNQTPASSPTRQPTLRTTMSALPAPPPLSVPMCPGAADFIERAPLPAPAPQTDFTSSQRLILPPLDSSLPDVHVAENDGEAEDSWLQPRWTDGDQQAADSLLAGPPAAGSPTSTTTGPKAEAEIQDIDSSASPLDSSLSQQLPDFTKLPGPAYASLGDYLQFTCESVRVQSEMIQQLVDSNKRQNMLIHRLSDKVESLSATQPLPEGWELASPHPGLLQPWTPEQQAELAKQLQDYARIQLCGSSMTVSHPSPTQPSLGVPAALPSPSVAAAALPSLLSLHLQPPAQQPRAPRSQQTYNCNDCRYRCSDVRNLDLHIAAKHQCPHHTTGVTLLVGDSHMKTVNCRALEKALSGGKLVCGEHIATKPQGRRSPRAGKPGRAYCSEQLARRQIPGVQPRDCGPPAARPGQVTSHHPGHPVSLL